MTRIRLRSTGWAARAPLTANARGLATLVLAASVTHCTFDVTPTASLDDRDAATSRSSASNARDAGSTEQRTRAATAERPAPETASDSGTRPPEPDAGQTSKDAGQPKPSIDAGAPADNTADSAASAPTRPTMDASTPGELMQPDTSRCMPGSYEGDFEGPVTFAVGSINRVTGTMTAELTLDPSGETLNIRNGRITGRDTLGVDMSANWTGTVSCTTNQLQGTLEAGAWENGSTFNGSLEGTYNPSPHSLSGTWQVESNEIPFAGGNGEWNMTLRESGAP